MAKTGEEVFKEAVSQMTDDEYERSALEQVIFLQDNITPLLAHYTKPSSEVQVSLPAIFYFGAWLAVSLAIRAYGDTEETENYVKDNINRLFEAARKFEKETTGASEH